MILREYQEIAVNNTLKDFTEHDKLGLILPTGAGKTVILNAITNRWINDSDCSVLILSHKIDLTIQTKKRYQEWFPFEKVGILQADKKPDPDCRVVIGTMQSAADIKRIRLWKREAKHKCSLVIVDEAHRILCDSYDRIFYELRDTKLLGVTATPYKVRQLMLNYFDKVSYTCSLGELIKDGYLVPPILKEVEATKNSTSDELAKVAHLYKSKEEGNRAIVYLRTKQEAQEMVGIFEHIGVKAVAVTADVKGASRQTTFKRFSEGKISVLTTVNVLTEGYDEPKVEAIFMPFPTSSPSVYMQRIGRGLRISEGKESCRVYVHGATPAIKRGFFKKMHDDVLDHTVDKPEDTYINDWELKKEAMTEELVQWTETVCTAIRRLDDMNCGTLSVMMNEKNFPDKFMNMIAEFNDALPHIKVSVADGNATKKQRGALKSVGFTESDMDTMTKRDASVIISFMMKANRNDGLITSGKMAGKHVTELPFFYKNHVLKNYPNSNVAKMIRNYSGG